jgi:peptide/nickel transport system permease protein
VTADLQVIDVGGLGEVGEPSADARVRALRRFRRDPVSMAALVLLLLLVVLALIGGPLAAHLTGHPSNKPFPNALDVNARPIGFMQYPHHGDGTGRDTSAGIFVLGADGLGRDLLVRTLYGARISLLVATAATAIALVIGVTLGLVAGYFGGWVDALVSRLTEFAMAFPNVLLAVGLAVVVGPGLLNVIAIIALFTWYYPARIVRGATMASKQMLFVSAARVIGCSRPRILRVHLLPQVWGPLLVYATSIIANNIIFEAGLSYLGVGIPAPTASWGQMLSEAVSSGMYETDIALALIPGVALVLTMLSFNLLGDGIRDALNPARGR